MWICHAFVFLTCAVAGAAPARPTGYTVILEGLPDKVPLGASIPLSYRLGNRSAVELELFADSLGTPVGLSVIDPTGSAVTRTPQFIGVEGFLRPQRFYRLPAGQEVGLRYDLSLLYVIDKPGTYTVRIAPDDAVDRADHRAPVPGAALVKAEFTVVPYRTLSTRRVSGHYRPAYLGTSFVDWGEDTENSAVRLSIVEAEGTAGPDRFLLIDEISVMKEARVGLPAYSLPVETGSTIEDAAMDFFGQVWVMLRCADAHSLVLWKINDLSWTVLVPPTDKEIVFGHGQARGGVAAPTFVAAGVKGQELFSTYSVSPYSFGGTGKADAARGTP